MSEIYKNKRRQIYILCVCWWVTDIFQCNLQNKIAWSRHMYKDSQYQFTDIQVNANNARVHIESHNPSVTTYTISSTYCNPSDVSTEEYAVLVKASKSFLVMIIFSKQTKIALHLHMIFYELCNPVKEFSIFYRHLNAWRCDPYCLPRSNVWCQNLLPHAFPWNICLHPQRR